MKNLKFLIAANLCLLFPIVLCADSVNDCSPVLQAKDYYSYASKNSLFEDYLRSIDSETWRVIQTSNDFDFGGIFSGGAFTVSDSYSTFDSKRTKYLETLHYTRSEQSALDILSITISPRAFSAYEACLRALGTSGPAVRVWAASEDMDKIQLRIKWVNTHVGGSNSVRLEGLIDGGSVTGAAKGRLWNGFKRWNNLQEFHFEIKRDVGTALTRVTVVPNDGSGPVLVTFKRADGLLTLKYVGTTDILRHKDRSGSQVTPNNDHNRGSCPGQVGHQDGKWCISRTTITMVNADPFFFKNARPGCTGGGCPWASHTVPATVSADGHTASASIDNWGSAVTGYVYADEYEKLAASKCGGDGPIPVIMNQAILFSAPKECFPIGTLQWTLLPSGSQGAMAFGDAQSPDATIIREGPVTDSGNFSLAAYKITSPSDSRALTGSTGQKRAN